MKIREDSRLGKGYSCFFALAVLGLVVASGIRLETTFSKKEGFGIKVQLVAIPGEVSLPGLALASSLLGFSSDGLADKIAGFLGYKKE